ncbi:MFS transporter [Nakamurella sp. YIM 132087]|uniref:MFS transporter n=1 Tax=Nakamurella alba TaxID=2665158 RepID=A0A7K1FE47_9ACTN|nr:MFS transporter [Nakamurella alba]
MGAGPDRTDRRSRTAALRAGILAFFVDQLDIYLPVLVLASIGGYFVPADVSASTSAVLTALVFAATLVTRPLGAMVFGHRADIRGRVRTTQIATAGFGVVTLLIAALPGAGTAGYFSIGALIALRAVNGVFLGGAYTAAVPLAMEWSAPRRRGVVAGLVLAAAPTAYATLALVTLLLQQLIPSDGSDSAYARWGWRIPFVVVGLLAFALVVHYGRRVREPETRRSSARERSPLAQLLTGPHRRALLQVLVLMSGVWLANNMVSAVLPGLLGSRLGLTGPQVSLTMAVEAIALALSLPLWGALSQRWGRRPFYLGYGVVMAVLGSGLYLLLMTARPGPAGALVLVAVLGVLTLGTLGPIAAYLTERFPSQLRATGFGVGYSLALVIPAFYAFYLSGLGRVLPDGFAPPVLVALAGILVLVGAALGPETRDVDLAANDRLP